MLEKVISLLAPHYCYFCQKAGSILCNHCKYNIYNLSFPCCLFCHAVQQKGICGKCQQVRGIERAYAVGARTQALKVIIDGLKFHRQRAAARTCAELLAGGFDELPVDAVFVPVPTMTAHVRMRGYDQCELITKHLSALTARPTASLLLRNKSFTQRGATKQERLLQARDAFTAPRELKEATTYIVVDDVITTGATLQAARDALYAAGARTIWVAAVAKQALDE